MPNRITAADELSVLIQLRPNRFGRPVRRNRGPVRLVHSAEVDAFTLVMLAEQEREENRTDQAECLIEAAYARYDQVLIGSDFSSSEEGQ